MTRVNLSKIATDLPSPINALEVALLVKALPVNAGAELIEQYARTFASGVRLDRTIRAHNRIGVAIESPLSRVNPIKAAE